MTTSKRSLGMAIVLVVLAVTSPLALVATTTTPAAAAPTEDMPTRDADLTVRQPEYIDGDVAEQTANGTPVYVASGRNLRLKPQNFDGDAVLNYGVDAPAGEMQYDDAMGVYQFDPGNNTGTFELWWVVEEETTVTRNNSTTTATRQVRYQALVRVDGQTAMAHVSQSTISQLREDADFGATAKEAIDEIREKDLLFARDSGSDAEILDAMATRYVTTGDPVFWLSGRYTQMWVLAILSLGGALFVLQFFVGFGYVIRQLRRKLNLTESIKAEEGELADRLAEADHEAQLRKAANIDWNDLTDDDHFASRLRETLGDTPLRGWQQYNSMIRPRNVFRDRVQAMGLAGYRARVEYDNDGDGNGKIRDAEIVPPGEEAVTDDAEDLVGLDAPDDDLLDALDPDDPTIREFDLTEADIDWSGLDTTFETMDLEELIQAFEADMEDFGDEETFGQYLGELFDSLRQHEFTDEDGRPDEVRYVLESWLDVVHQYHDVFQAPLSEYQRAATETALETWDRNDQARRFVREVQSGNVGE